MDCVASEISDKRLTISMAPTKVEDLASLIKSKTQVLFVQHDYSLNLKVEPELESKVVLLDQDAFAQIMINLVDNGIKYSPNNVNKNIDIQLYRRQPNQLAIRVRDHGIGIAADELDKVFDLFYRVGNELTRTAKGTGLGLALVKELTGRIQGQIEVQPQQQGTAFILCLPLED